MDLEASDVMEVSSYVLVDGDVDSKLILRTDDENDEMKLTAIDIDDSKAIYGVTAHEEFVYEEKSIIWSLTELLDLFVRALLGHGVKTLTHVARVLENYRELLIWFR